MKVVAETLGVARSNLIDRLEGKTKPRRHYYKAQYAEVVPLITALVRKQEVNRKRTQLRDATDACGADR